MVLIAGAEASKRTSDSARAPKRAAAAIKKHKRVRGVQGSGLEKARISLFAGGRVPCAVQPIICLYDTQKRF